MTKKLNTGGFVLKLLLLEMKFWPFKAGDCLIQVAFKDKVHCLS